MIHIVNGDVWGERLRGCTPLKGEVFVWREMYDLGPFSPDWEREEWIQRRAAFFEERIGLPAEQMKMINRYQEQRLDRIPSTTQVVLWFGSDRYDQLMLLYLLTRMRDGDRKGIDWVEVPAKGADQLSDGDLVRLFEERLPIEEEHLVQAAEVWQAYISDDPRDVERWLHRETGRFPYAFTALRRHIQYFPSCENGLNAVEALALRIIGEESPPFSSLFREVNRQCPEDGLSDVHFAAILNELGDCETPLIQTEASDSGEGRIHLTPLGKRVLIGTEDRLAACGIDWWLGGVHLTADTDWRRDANGHLYRRK
ncbi:protein of unknown function [Melghirimyces thermohalophilus]|uniref:DUF1835 domain-containing protein n=1 Tax=Melghirimyces thermohalophilus TaxID=1236220 RepID=A0A1G6IJH1_9BACL|nr:DUF1835 domain-containing protein [Melghirimyces thermohalophilus]SDC05866.1 protein of unknown function [Melghirimyces thermohalophilus]